MSLISKVCRYLMIFFVGSYNFLRDLVFVLLLFFYYYFGGGDCISLVFIIFYIQVYLIKQWDGVIKYRVGCC